MQSPNKATENTPAVPAAVAGVEGVASVDAVTGRVSEAVSALPKEAGTGGDAATGAKTHSLFDFGGRISSVLGGLFSSAPKAAVIPSLEVQRQRVEKNLDRRVRRLLAQTKRLQNSGRFTADKLERIIFQIRSLQEILKSLVHLAADAIEQLYRRYVLVRG